MILPLMIETLTSKEGMDVNERLHVNSWWGGCH